MKRTFTLLMLFAAMTLGAAAQGLTATSCRLLRGNLQARTQQRIDTSSPDSAKCALILVEVVGVKNLSFKEAVGDVKYAYNQYEVYVPANTKTLTYSNNEVKGQVKISEDFGLDLEPMSTYRLDFKSANNLHSATFYVSPADATLTFAGEPVKLDADGVACIERAAGEYNFSVSAPGYQSYDGTVKLAADEANEVTDVALNPIYHQVSVVCNAPKASVIVDDKPYGTVNSLPTNFMLPEGKHSYRFSEEGYHDAEGTFGVYQSGAPLNVNLRKMRDKIVRHTEERSRTEGAIRGYRTVELSGLTYMNDLFKSYRIRFRDTENSNYAGIFTWRWLDLGISVGLLKDDTVNDFDCEKDDSKPLYNIEDAMQAGVIIPLTKHNNYFFTALGGVYAGCWTYYEDNDGDKGKLNDGFGDFGLRVSASFVFNRFVLGAEFNKSFLYGKVSSVGVTLGIRIQKK